VKVTASHGPHNNVTVTMTLADGAEVSWVIDSNTAPSGRRFVDVSIVNDAFDFSQDESVNVDMIRTLVQGLQQILNATHLHNLAEARRQKPGK
jgi:hypothetical protein